MTTQPDLDLDEKQWWWHHVDAEPQTEPPIAAASPDVEQEAPLPDD